MKKKKEYDISTLTAADYTVEMHVSSLFHKFILRDWEDFEGDSDAMKFCDFLKINIEDLLNT